MLFSCSVSTSKCDRPVRLNDIVLGVHGKYGDVFPAAISKQRNTKTTLCTFNTGSVINTGSRSKAESLLAITLLEQYYTRLYNRHIRILDWNVTNVVLSCNLGYAIDMDKVDMYYSSLSGFWRSSTFPGFALKQIEMGVTFIVFAEGGVNCTGCKDLSQIDAIYKRAQDLLYRCRKI